MENKEQLDFESIRPYEDHEIQTVFNRLKKETSFMNLLGFLYPAVPAEEFMDRLTTMTSVRQFQEEVVSAYIKKVLEDTTKGVTVTGLDRLDPEASYLFISNHRDILLDPAILNVQLVEHGFNTTEIAIGDNLLIFPWITDLVKLNRTFIVKRNLTARKILESSRTLSAYIRHALKVKKRSIWIAQREGRSKDGNDRTQVSLMKMFNISGQGDLLDNFKELKIVPVSVSYEFDPCDYLKAEEFYLKQTNPDFAKTQDDDLKHMITGLKGRKGHIHISFGKPLIEELNPIATLTIKNDQFAALAKIIDEHVHANYKLWPGNYVAWDLLNKSTKYADHYSQEEKETFTNYIEEHIKRTKCDSKFVYQNLLEMYANPLINKLKEE